MTAKLNVNIDHVATIREARKTIEPCIIAAAVLCEQADSKRFGSLERCRRLKGQRLSRHQANGE